MQEATAVHGHEVIALVADRPEGIALDELAGLVTGRFGTAVTFHTCCAEGMDLGELLAFLEARDKVRVADGKAFPGGAPPCDH